LLLQAGFIHEDIATAKVIVVENELILPTQSPLACEIGDAKKPKRLLLHFDYSPPLTHGLFLEMGGLGLGKRHLQFEIADSSAPSVQSYGCLDGLGETVIEAVMDHLRESVSGAFE
jgi:hypothetical protein